MSTHTITLIVDTEALRLIRRRLRALLRKIRKERREMAR